MLKSVVRDGIFNAVTERLKAAGFSSQKKNHCFVRKFDGGYQELVLPIVDRRSIQKVSVLGMVRLDVVANIAFMFDDSLPPETKATADVIRFNQDYFSGNPGDYSIGNEVELANAIDAILAMLEKDMLPFLLACESLEFVEKILNGPSGERLVMFDHTRALNGVVAAHLCGRSDVEQLGEKYRAELRANGSISGAMTLSRTLKYILKGSE